MSPLEFWVRFLILGVTCLVTSILFLSLNFLSKEPKELEVVKDVRDRPSKGGNVAEETVRDGDTYNEMP
jgi:hypothetical protein